MYYDVILAPISAFAVHVAITIGQHYTQMTMTMPNARRYE